MIKSYIDEIYSFLALVNNNYFNNINCINNDNFLEYYNIYWRYKNLEKLLQLRYSDKNLNKLIYDEFINKITQLNHIKNEQEYQIKLSQFINDNLIQFQYKFNTNYVVSI